MYSENTENTELGPANGQNPSVSSRANPLGLQPVTMVVVFSPGHGADERPTVQEKPAGMVVEGERILGVSVTGKLRAHIVERSALIKRRERNA